MRDRYKSKSAFWLMAYDQGPKTATVPKDATVNSQNILLSNKLSG